VEEAQNGGKLSNLAQMDQLKTLLEEVLMLLQATVEVTLILEVTQTLEVTLTLAVTATVTVTLVALEPLKEN